MKYILFGSMAFNVLFIVIIAFYAKKAEEDLWEKYIELLMTKKITKK